MFFSFDNCNHLDVRNNKNTLHSSFFYHILIISTIQIVLIMTCYIFFSAQVCTRKRLRKILLAFFVSTFLSLLWFFIFPQVFQEINKDTEMLTILIIFFVLFPQKWNSIDYQYKETSKAWKVFIPIAQLSFIIIKVTEDLIKIRKNLGNIFLFFLKYFFDR